MIYTVGSLFSGIGGIDYAFQSAGFEIAFQCEIDKYCNQVLAKHWSNVTRYQDVRTITGNQTGYVDVLAGGFPCQDISQAGKRRGIKDGTRSGLWFEFARLIGEIRPRIVFLENVAAITFPDDRSGSLEPAPGFIVLGDLAEMGYDVQWFTLFASDAGSPQERERWFAVAHTRNSGWQTGRGSRQERSILHRENGIVAKNQRAGERRGAESQFVREILELGSPVRRPNGSNKSKRASGFKPGMVRNAYGVSGGVDNHKFPKAQGTAQYPYEPPRTVPKEYYPNQAKRKFALGNAVVPQVVYPIAQAILAYLEAQDAQQEAA